jgi:hypothetical protein
MLITSKNSTEKSSQKLFLAPIFQIPKGWDSRGGAEVAPNPDSWLIQKKHRSR